MTTRARRRRRRNRRHGALGRRSVVRTLGLSRFDLHYAIGRVPHDQRLATIELYGREVIPRIRELLDATSEAHDTLAAGVRN